MENIQHMLTDIQVLLAFLKEETSEQCGHEAQVTSLQTLSNMCTKEGAEILNKCGGISLILKLCWATEHDEVCQACLYTLACAAESNDQVQASLCSEYLFGILKAVMESSDVSQRTQLLCIYFLASLVSHSKRGQDLMMSSGCLEKLLKILASGIEVATSDKTRNTTSTLELWKVTAKALVYTINIPRNEANQNKCSKCFRYVISILHETRKNSELVMESCKFLSAALDSNEYCRTTALSCRLLEVLIIRLQSCNVTNNGKVIGELVTTLSNLLPEKGDHCERFGNLGGILLLIDLLKDPSELTVTVHQTNHIIAVLIRCANASEKNRQQLIQLNAANVLARLMKCIPNNECFNKLAVHLLNQCLPENCPQRKNARIDDLKGNILDLAEARPSEDSKTMSNITGDQENLVKDDDEKNSHSKSVIDSLQAEMKSLKHILLQVNEKQEKSSKKLDEIYKQNSVISLSSDNLRESGLSGRTQSAKKKFYKPRKTTKKRSSRAFEHSCSRRSAVLPPNKDTSCIMTSTLLLSPGQRNLPPKFRPEEDLSFRKENLNRSVFVINDQGVDESILKTLNNCEGSRGEFPEILQEEREKMSEKENIIDVERLSPRDMVRERITKYYVKKDGKILQHVIRHDSSSNRDWTPAPSRQNIRQLEDDILSQCSEVTLKKKHGYIRKIHSEFHPQKNRHPAYQENKKSSDDIYQINNIAFKKPTKPRFKSSKRTNNKMKFSTREEKNLKEGVKNLGPNWKDILYAYEFHPTRTSVDLKDKYRNILRKKAREKC